jgi:hypothetical protein
MKRNYLWFRGKYGQLRDASVFKDTWQAPEKKTVLSQDSTFLPQAEESADRRQLRSEASIKL